MLFAGRAAGPAGVDSDVGGSDGVGAELFGVGVAWKEGGPDEVAVPGGSLVGSDGVLAVVGVVDGDLPLPGAGSFGACDPDGLVASPPVAPVFVTPPLTADALVVDAGTDELAPDDPDPGRMIGPRPPDGGEAGGVGDVPPERPPASPADPPSAALLDDPLLPLLGSLPPPCLPRPFVASCTAPPAATPPMAALAPMERATPSPATAPSIIGMTRINPNGINAASNRIAEPWIIATFPPSPAAVDISDALVASVTAIANLEKINATAVSVALRA